MGFTLLIPSRCTKFKCCFFSP